MELVIDEYIRRHPGCTRGGAMKTLMLFKISNLAELDAHESRAVDNFSEYQLDFSDTPDVDRGHKPVENPGQKMEQLIQIRMKKDDTLSYSEAFANVQLDYPLLTDEYIMSL